MQDRIYVSQTANVTAEINEIAENIADELVDDTLRRKLREVFKPVKSSLYDADRAILPALDEIVMAEDRVRLVIPEHAADNLPPAFERWWEDQTGATAFCC